MSRYLWLRPLAHRWLGRSARKASPTRPVVWSLRRVRPFLEGLEDRITPTTFTPSVLTDGVTGNPNGTLRDAISAANADTGTATDTIQLAAGLYTLSIANAAGHETANASGDLNITNTSHALVIQGATDASGHPTTTIQQTKADRVFQIVNPGTTVTFKDLIIEDGNAQEDGKAGTAAGSTEADGGGILDDGGNVTLSNVALRSNSAVAGAGFAARGGGIYVATGGSLTIQSSSIAVNKVLGGDGGTSATNAVGGVAEGGGVFALGQVSIAHSNLSDNTVTGGSGGSGSSFGGGGPADGGSVAFDSNATLTMTITDSNLSSNTVTGGSSSGFAGGSAQGGSIFAFGSTTITDSFLTSNTVIGGNGSIINNDGNFTLGGDIGGDAQGGSIFAFGPSTITACTLVGNTLSGGQGSYVNSNIPINGDVGGEAQGGGVFAGGPTTITTSFLSGNTLTGGQGSYNGTGAVSGSIGGSAAGGGLCVNFSEPKVTVNITASTLSGNTLTGGSGSGSIATPGLAQGGGASFAGTGTILVNSTIASNRAIGGQSTAATEVATGGGLMFASTATATLTNDTVADNNASPIGSGNGDAFGGGITNFGTISLRSTLVAGNIATNNPDYSGTVSNSDHNLIGNADGSSGFSASHGDLFGSTANPLNPQLGLLQNNGGPTPTIAPLPSSPALHAGDVSDELITGAFDQRGQGFFRVINDTIDIGAFEVQPPPPPSSPPPSWPPSPPPHGSSPTPKPPTLHTPALLAFFDALLHGIEKVNGNDTETVTDSFFGNPLLISTYDGNGDLVSVSFFGINVTSLFEMPL